MIFSSVTGTTCFLWGKKFITSRHGTLHK